MTEGKKEQVFEISGRCPICQLEERLQKHPEAFSGFLEEEKIDPGEPMTVSDFLRSEVKTRNISMQQLNDPINLSVRCLSDSLLKSGIGRILNCRFIIDACMLHGVMFIGKIVLNESIESGTMNHRTN